MSSRRAFTLLEVLMATVLATVLMIGVLAVVTTLGAPVRAPAGPGGAAAKTATEPPLDDASVDALVGLLRKDLDHATRIDTSRPNELTLLGYDALDSGARERTQRPVRVLYRIEEIDGRRWLVRRQAALDVLTNRNVQRDLVCAGLARFEVSCTGGASGVKPDVVPPEETMVTWGKGADRKPETSAGQGAKADASATGGSAGVTAQASAGDGEDDMVFYHAHYIYIKYIPWLRKKSAEAANAADGANPSAAAPGGTDGAGTDSARPGGPGGAAHEADAAHAGAGRLNRHETVTWRLRAWSAEQAKSAFDRVVTTK